MFSIFGGAETRRLPGASQFPWKAIGLGFTVLITLAVLALGARVAYSAFTSRGDTVTVSAKLEVLAVSNPQEQTNSQTTTDQSAQPFDPSTSLGAQDLRPVQQVPVVTAPVAPKVVNYQVVWTEVRDFDPSTIPVEEGFYNGTRPYQISWRPDVSTDIPEGDVFAWKILPHLREAGRGTNVAAARDQSNKDIVLADIDPAALYTPYILLSVNEGKSWCTLNLLPSYWWKGKPLGDGNEIRVVARNGEIHLYVRSPKGPGPSHLYWWEATVSKSELPCS